MTKLNPTTEYQEHIAFVRWFELNYPKIKHLLMHYPSGEKREFNVGVKLKKMGVKRGIPDFFLAVPLIHDAGLWIELKSKKGKITKEQEFYLHDLAEHGYKTVVAYGWEEAAKIVKDYLDFEKRSEDF